MTEIKVMSDQEHTIEIDQEYIEESDLSPHVKVVEHIKREYSDAFNKFVDIIKPSSNDRGRCSECRFYLEKHNDCLIYSGFIAVDKMKSNARDRNCESYKPY